MVIAEDPFHIMSNADTQERLNTILDSKGCLDFNSFMDTFLRAVERVLDKIFSSKRNPSSLLRVTTNQEYMSWSCQRCFRETQCDKCTVAVSRTKIGACLQFSWANTAYCSIDIVPKFAIQTMDSMKLAAQVNRGMATLETDLWFGHLRNYMETDMVLQDAIEEGNKMVNAVILKQIVRSELG